MNSAPLPFTTSEASYIVVHLPSEIWGSHEETHRCPQCSDYRAPGNIQDHSHHPNQEMLSGGPYCALRLFEKFRVPCFHPWASGSPQRFADTQAAFLSTVQTYTTSEHVFARQFLCCHLSHIQHAAWPLGLPSQRPCPCSLPDNLIHTTSGCLPNPSINSFPGREKSYSPPESPVPPQLAEL